MQTETYEIVGRKVETERRDLGWSQATLAAQAGVKPATLRKIERGGSSVAKMHPASFSSVAEAIRREYVKRGNPDRAKLELAPDSKLRAELTEPTAAAAAACLDSLHGYWLELNNGGSGNSVSVGHFQTIAGQRKYDGWNYTQDYEWRSDMFQFDIKRTRIIYTYEHQRGGIGWSDGMGAIELNSEKAGLRATQAWFVDLRGESAELNQCKLRRLGEAMRDERYSWTNHNEDDEENRKAFVARVTHYHAGGKV